MAIKHAEVNYKFKLRSGNIKIRDNLEAVKANSNFNTRRSFRDWVRVVGFNIGFTRVFVIRDLRKRMLNILIS